MISIKFLCSLSILYLYITTVKAWKPLTFIPFRKWNEGRVLKKHNMSSIPEHVLLSQTSTDSCFSREECRNLLNSSIVSTVIPNFYVSGNGEIYVGHAWNSVAIPNLCLSDDIKPMIEISLIGDFEESKLSKEQLKAAQKLLEYGLAKNKLSRTYDLFGEWQLTNEDYPVHENNRENFETWPHWVSDLSQCVALDYQYDDKEIIVNLKHDN